MRGDSSTPEPPGPIQEGAGATPAPRSTILVQDRWTYPEVIETAFTREQACALIRRSTGVLVWVKTIKGAQASFSLTKPEAIRQIRARFSDDLPPISLTEESKMVWIG